MTATFAGEGFHLGLCARGEPTAPQGSEAWTASIDVSDAEALDGFALGVVERFGRIDLWVNNAGVLEPIGALADAIPVLCADTSTSTSSV
jgi:benzil reductase ((S)-benzoin forming)